MPLKAEVSTLDEVPETFRGEYEEVGGKYRLKVEGVEFPSDVEGLRSALEKEKARRRELSEKLAQMPPDFDPAKWAALTEAEKKREEAEALQRGEFEQVKADIQRRAEEREKALLSQLDHHLRDQAILAAGAEHDAYTHLLPDVVSRYVTVREEDGKRVPVVLDDAGKVRYNDAGDRMTVAEFVGWMKGQERYWPLFKGEGMAGGGASGRGGAGGARSKPIKDMSESEKVAFVHEHGLDRYLELLRA